MRNSPHRSRPAPFTPAAPRSSPLLCAAARTLSGALPLNTSLRRRLTRPRDQASLHAAGRCYRQCCRTGHGRPGKRRYGGKHSQYCSYSRPTSCFSRHKLFPPWIFFRTTYLPCFLRVFGPLNAIIHAICPTPIVCTRVRAIRSTKNMAIILHVILFSEHRRHERGL